MSKGKRIYIIEFWLSFPKKRGRIVKTNQDHKEKETHTIRIIIKNSNSKLEQTYWYGNVMYAMHKIVLSFLSK